ncbi:MAG: UDP-N-acetylglucosamine--N-acetylmuramyl-(pentapeptide) pyrophosphoryl-undecaprenol N-acetylglucosamine transferase [Sulfurospirillaceae bacterium]|nr:UDP-N-acetylglucosamine--N-acetylmuramyl-(pentapeptide) pyrophosphoryl-undecaprenol N-acetylglucosamine transferase [Sulfurospirillaceae bacterium]MCK9545423.1 UDP-N-acetylglucosamine--N-acetylmuramyl-(pentapeptide) pyrophosphoryl-undecaprenol N-acetylglucosamine transferase [Sulfurospirillaceae bacterium]MDY0237835.1 UDP-N-acetylglucosamine--N-acetylmuramyl-(pentapeptide) pyrophosphoryl-undecaprenol N-acetylglucosamine transferase [Campylobacterales bacterium]
MILITGGGTGGHLSIAKTLCEEYNNKNIRPLYIGSSNGLDKEWFDGYPGFKSTIFLSTYGVVNRGFFGKIKSLFNIFKKTLWCREFIKNKEVKAVISVGGYAAAPASFAAILTKTPLFIHEQNAKLGTLNKLLKPFAKEFFSSYEKSSSIKDYPVSERFFKAFRKRSEVKTILFLGGSQGAEAINSLAISLAPWLKEKDIKIIHQCGKVGEKKVVDFYEKNSINATVFAFSLEVDKYMHQADIAIARSGAGTLWELTAAGVPTLFIPYPHAASNHQFFNALFLKDRALASIITQDKLNIKEVKKWIENVEVKSISTLLQQQIKPDGAKKIIGRIESGSI